MHPTSPDPLARDFRNFLYVVWKHLNLPDPTPVQYDIAKFLMSDRSRIAIEAFRGVGKSWVTSAYVLWELYRDPQKKIMVVSASKNRADNFTSFCLMLINTMDILAHLRPTPNQRCSRIEFDVGPSQPDQTPSMFSRGITSQLTGGRADIIVSDDVEIPSNSATVEMREKLSEKTKEYSAILKPYSEELMGDFRPRIVYLGTPQTEDSIYTNLPSTFVKRIWPALVPLKDELANYGDDLAPMIREMFDAGKPGQPSDPQRFTAADLSDRRAEYGAAGFQLQFMLNTRLSDEERFPLKLRDLIVADVPPERAPMRCFWMPNPDRRMKDLPCVGMAEDALFGAAGFDQTFGEYAGRVLAIDPSGRGEDETGYAVGFQLNGYIWVPEAGGLPGGYDHNTLEFLAKLAKKHKVTKVVVESNFGDGMYTRLFEPILLKHHKCEVAEVRHSTMKEARMLDTLEPVFSQHRLVVDPSVFKKDVESCERYDGDMKTFKTLAYQFRHPDTGETVPSAEEWAIHDYDNMPSSLGEYSGLQAVADVVELVEEIDWLQDYVVCAVIDHTGGDVDAAREMLTDNYRGQYRDWQELAEEYVAEGLFGEVPEHLENYLDYDRIAADLQHDMTEIVVNGYSHFFWDH